MSTILQAARPGALTRVDGLVDGAYPALMLSQKARYALRALIHLAGNAGEGAVPAAEIATLQKVPRKFCEVILTELKQAGMVSSRRGPGGGYVLARPANDIDFAEVVRLMDGPIALVPCASQNFYERCGDCQDEATCAIRRVMAQVRDQAAETLAGTTIADAVRAERATA